jgi:hypothetical protein
VLPGLHKLPLQGFFSEYRVAVSLKHVGLLAGPLRDVLHIQHMSNGTQH